MEFQILVFHLTCTISFDNYMRKGTSLLFLLNFSFWGNCRFTYSCRKILCICYPVSHNGNILQNYFLFCFVFTHSSTCSHRWATVFKTEMNHTESWKFGYMIKGLLTKIFFTEKSMVTFCSLHDCLIAYYNPNWKRTVNYLCSQMTFIFLHDF